MARRINTPFVIILAAVLVALTTGVVLAWYFGRTTTDEYITQGKLFREQGEMALALEEFSKAIAKDPQNVPLLMMYADTVYATEVSDARKAKDDIGRMRIAWQAILALEPAHPEAFSKLMGMFQTFARDLGGMFVLWRRMYQRCEEALSRHPGWPEAIKFRGISQTRRIGRLDLDEEERLQARDDLRTALEHDPDDLDIYFHLILWRLKEAALAERPPTRPDDAARHREIARELSDQMFAQFDDDPQAQLHHLRLLVELKDREAADPLMDRLEKTMLAGDVLAEALTTKMVVQLAELLAILDREKVELESGETIRRGWVRARRLLTRAKERSPSDVVSYVTLGRILKQMSKTEEALEIYNRGREITAKSNPIYIHLMSHLQLICTLEYAELRLEMLADVFEEEERETVLLEAEELLAECVKLTGEIWQLQRLRGKIAMVRGEWEKALAQFDRANEQVGDTNPELLMISARMRDKLGERGAATVRYKELIKLVPGYLPAYEELARLHVKLQELNEARVVIEQLLHQDPEHMEGWRLKAALLVRYGQYDEAIEIIEQLDPKKYPALIPTLADYHRRAGRVDEATRMFQEYFKEHPKNFTVLRELISLTTDEDEASAYIEQARQGGADENLLKVLQGSLDGVDFQEEALKLVEGQGGGVEQHLNRYRVYRQLEKADEARAQLEAAAQIDPNHGDLIDLQFSAALGHQDWKEAEVLAGRAADNDLDQAVGNFYFGRLYYATGEFERSVASFKEALGRRRVYSIGWRWLGDAQLAMGDPSEAIVSYKISIRQRPDNVGALRGLARVHHREGKYSLALDRLRQAIEYAPANKNLRAEYLSYEQQYGDAAVAVSFCQRRAQNDPEDFGSRRSLAIMLAKFKQADEAIWAIDAVIEDSGESLLNMGTKAIVLAEGSEVEAGRQVLQSYVEGLGDEATAADWMELGRFLFDYGRVEAPSAYRQGIAIEDPVKRSASRALADRLFQIGRIDEAVDLYRDLWDTSPGDQLIGLRYVEALVRVESFEDAENVLQTLVKKFPDDSRTFMVDGLVAQGKGQTDRAFAAYNQAVEKSPHWPMPYYQRAQLRSNDPRHDEEVIEDLNRALELDRDLAVARRRLAKVHLSRGDRDDAIRELQTLLRRTPGDYTARMLLVEIFFNESSHVIALRELLEESAALYPTDPAWPLLRGTLEQNQGRPDDAIVHLQRAVKMQPYPNSLGKLTTLYMMVNQPEKVLDLLREHPEMSKQPQLQAMRGRALSALDRDAEASDAFVQAIQACQSQLDIFSVAQQIVTTLGFDRAIEEIEGLASGDQAIWLELVLAQLLSTRGDYKNVLARLEKLDAKMAPDAEEREVFDQVIAVAQYRTGDFEATKLTYERILERDPSDLKSLNDLAYILANDLDEPERALDLAIKAASLAPDDPAVLDTLGWAHFKAGDLGEARRVLQRSVGIKPMAPNCLHLAEVMIKENDRTRARELLESASQLAIQHNELRNLQRVRKLLQVIKIQDISSQ